MTMMVKHLGGVRASGTRPMATLSAVPRAMHLRRTPKVPGLRWNTTKSGRLSQSLAPCQALSAAEGAKVLVTGAGGRTGSLVLEKLLAQGLDVKGMVRTEKSKQKLLKKLGSDCELVVGDVTSTEDVERAMKGVTHLCLVSSAKPQIKKRSLVRILFKKLLRMDPGRPTFRWAENGEPRLVDFVGGVNQIDAAKAEGVKQIVYCGSMGGTQSDNFLNTIGGDGNGNGDGKILLWKRKAEEYLIASGITYTIVHPGGLLDKAEGKRKLVVDVDDKILETKQRSVPRGDVANLIVDALGMIEAYNKAFDLASKEEQENEVETDFAELIDSLEGKSCNYELNKEDVEALRV